jgi:threonine/homoserine/homoserine lactone efflux protein
MPIDSATLLLFSLAAVLLLITPGPDMLLVLSRSIAQGAGAGLVTLLGIFTGCYVHAVAAGLGLSGLFAAAPLAFDAVRLAGAAYLLWLAWQALKPGAPPVLAPEGTPRAGLWRVYRQGLLINLLNPKVVLFFLALFPQFVDPARGSLLLQSLILVTVLNLLGLAVNGAVALAAGRLGAFLRRNPRIARLQQRALGAVFGGLALRLLILDRT